MTAFLQNCLNGISIGSIYALIAIGYTMVYGILRLINFAHGDIFMMAGYFMIICMTDLLIPWYISLLLVVLFTVLLGVFIERIAYKPLRDAPRMSIMISAIGVSYFLQNFATYLFTAQPKSYPYAEMGFLSKTVKLGEISTTLVTFITPILTVILVLALAFLIRKTKIGMAMRAVSRDFETSCLMGIKINRVISFTFAVGSALAAIGSVLYFIPRSSVYPLAGSLPGLKCFVAAVFGAVLFWTVVLPLLPESVSSRFALQAILESRGTGRVDIWLSMLETISESKWELLLGRGVLAQHEFFLGGQMAKWAAHNQFIQALYNQGIPGLLAFLLMSFGAVFRNIKKRPHIAAAMLGMLALCMTLTINTSIKTFWNLLIYAALSFDEPEKD